MHELSIAMSIVELAEEEAVKAGASVISIIEVEIGSLAGIETDALSFCWDSAIRDTMASQAQLVIHPIGAEAHCLDCGNVFPVNDYYSGCPSCQGFQYRITKGKELRIKSLIVE